ncbi:hypothetical protein Lesp01_24720 [Lentzea sp. NBRC 102530]|nr:hypothetical protein Lesp01_24720 [Lentzea sp. NBRC 102530]
MMLVTFTKPITARATTETAIIVSTVRQPIAATATATAAATPSALPADISFPPD